jgi:hypothetical protein
VSQPKPGRPPRKRLAETEKYEVYVQVLQGRVAGGSFALRLPQNPLCKDQHNRLYVQPVIMLRTPSTCRGPPGVTRFRR